MILVDSSIWIDHLRKSDRRLVRLLDEDLVLMHPWVKGELALGSIANRDKFFRLLGYLTELRPERDAQILELIESQRLWGRGIGWVDAGLLASCLSRHCLLWSGDKRLASIALEFGVAAEI